jgi:ABC-type phosphate transport system substrate-binding protein
MANDRECWAAKIIRRGLLALAFASSASIALADPITIQGSTTFARRLMEPFRTEIEKITGHELTVLPNKSTPGLIALLEGRTHLTMISSSLESEIALLQKSMPGMQFDSLRAFEVSRTRVAIAIHSSNPVRKVTLNQVTQVLQGKISNWSALGGPNQPIGVVLVGGGGGVTTVVESALLNGQQTSTPNKLYVKTPVQLVRVVEQERNALGFAQLALVQQRNGTELATDKPIEQVLYFVTLGEPTPAMQSVIDATRTLAAKMM